MAVAPDAPAHCGSGNPAGWIGHSRASSHMDAPLITLDPAANTTDVYALFESGRVKGLVAALGVYPPGARYRTEQVQF